MKSYLKSLLGRNEQIVLVAHQHWLVLAGEILSESVLTLALIILVTLIWQVWAPDPRIALGYLLLIFPLVSLLRDVLTWLNRQYIVTNRRVIQISGVFNKDVTDSSLEKVNDVKMEQSVLGRMFDFGDIEILTASDLGVNLFKRIGSPIRFKTAMLDAKDRMAGASVNGGKGATPDIPTLVAQLDNLRKQGVITEEEFAKKKADLLARL
jgi:hypothetical protein